MLYRSKFESKIGKEYPDMSYEAYKVTYRTPPQKHYYTPDFMLQTKSGKTIFIEAKGRFSAKDRQKMLLVKQQYPDMDIRFIFQNPNITISSTSKTTVAEWCIKNNFLFGNINTIKKWQEE